MRLKTFRAKTLADALVAVKKDLGKDAVILHTRSVKVGGWFGLGARKAVEIIASDEVNIAGPRLRSASRTPPAAPEPPPAVAPSRAAAMDAYRRVAAPQIKTESAVAQPHPPAAAPSPAPTRAGDGAEAAVAVLPVRQRLHARSAEPAQADSIIEPRGTTRPLDRLRTPVVLDPQDGAARSTLERELAAIKAMVGQVLQNSAPTPAAGLMPEALFKHYLKLLEGQVARELADRIVGAVRDELNAGELMDESIVRQTMLRHLAAMIPVAPTVGAPARAADGRALTIALIGPTGVGKTTTIAKLAAAYKLRYGKKVGLITSDTYRIAAVEQLRTYASIISLPLKVVMTPAEMEAACESLSDCDVILIDTAGRSPNDTPRLDELRAFIEAARPHETHLVLSTASSEAVLTRAAEQFAVVRPNRLILTKLDEAVSYGVVINVAERLGAKFSFVTTGQEVPDHIEPGHADRLARLVLDGELTR